MFYDQKEDGKKKKKNTNFDRFGPEEKQQKTNNNRIEGDNGEVIDAMAIPEGYNIGDGININKDGSKIEYGPWKIHKNNESEDTVNYSLELDAMIIDDTGEIGNTELEAYKNRIKSSFESVYATGEGTFFDKRKKRNIQMKWTGKINIKTGQPNSKIGPDVMHVRIRKNGQVAGTVGGQGFGYAYHGYSVVYINESILQNAPASEGLFKGSGLSNSGAPTLERTFSHEVFHTLFLFHTREQSEDPYFNIPKSRFESQNEGKNLMEESRKDQQPNSSAGEKLIPDQLDVIDRRMQVKNSEKFLKEDLRKRNKKR